jgi:formate--tetrahydrofolate ligase
MGAERFFNIKCRTSRLVPDAAVVVTTVRALKLHSGRHKVVAGRPLPPAMVEENPDEVHLGAANLLAHLAIVRRHGVTPVVAVNAFEDDYPSEHEAIREIAASVGVRTAICTHFTQGGKGAVELAEAVVEACEAPSEFHMLYEDGATLRQKIETIATEVYGADGVDYLPAASRHLDNYERAGFGRLPVCIAKTHLSISSDPKLLGAPKGWRLPVREARANVGAGFVYLVSGDMRTMPGLSRHPAAEQIDIDEDGNVVGLY